MQKYSTRDGGSVEFTRLIETGDNVIKLVSQTSFLTDTTYLMYATSL